MALVQAVQVVQAVQANMLVLVGLTSLAQNVKQAIYLEELMVYSAGRFPALQSSE